MKEWLQLSIEHLRSTRNFTVTGFIFLLPWFTKLHPVSKSWSLVLQLAKQELRDFVMQALSILREEHVFLLMVSRSRCKGLHHYRQHDNCNLRLYGASGAMATWSRTMWQSVLNRDSDVSIGTVWLALLLGNWHCRRKLKFNGLDILAASDLYGRHFKAVGKAGMTS
ncbi:hypothetical protein KIN20_004342 [Parelaphostrongylus tenuis]|uniref:Uncharacterized protein n=1 Tax=Parelaphostrongylus tenuis TaxID=148309 RepID=A0AAD5M2Y6_PARTN|nr:hypothetical protein KIN20_004342 [Parelaphostrongylus tenuis]